MLNNKAVTINGDGKQTRDYAYVADVVEANTVSLFQGNGENFNIGTGIETNVNELAEKLSNSIGSKAELKHGPAKAGEQKRSVINPAKAKDALGWSPKISIDEELRKTVNYYKRNKNRHG